MRSLEGQHHRFDHPVTWMPLVWTLVVILGAVFAAGLALPPTPGYVQGAITVGDIFRPEWLVLATLLVLPVYRVARSSWRAALFVVPVACVHVLYVADTAVTSLHKAGFTSGLLTGWYVVAFAQAALFATVGLVGVRRGLIEGRWARMMKRMIALEAPPRTHRNDPRKPPIAVDPPGRPENGFQA